MKICLLSRDAQIYSTRRLREAAELRGHQALVVNPARCYMKISSADPLIRYRGNALTGFDAVIPRFGASLTFYGSAVLRQFEMMGVYPLNESVAVVRARDKLRALQLLARKGIGLPVTGFAHAPDDSDDLLDLLGGAPLVLKLVEDAQGRGVILGETRKALESLVDAFRGLKANFLVQEFIKESGGTDVRCFVIGERVVAAMMRTGKEGEFRSNVHRGGSANAVKITPQERKLAVRAARIIGLSVAGVDILRSDHGPLVLEVNSTPGLEAIENSTQIDVADKIIEFIEKSSPNGKTRTRGHG